MPLYEELKIINDNFKHKAIVICDDLRLFGDKFKHGDWTHITKDGVKKMVKDRLINSFGNSVPDDSPWGMDSLILELK